MKTVTLQVAYGCNLRCRMCPNLGRFHDAGTREMAAEDAISVVQQANDAGARCIRMMALGESTLYSGFDAVCHAIAAENMDLSIDATNGTMLTSLDADVFNGMHAVKVVVSIDSPDKGQYEWLRGEGMWDRVWDGVAWLRDRHPHLAVTVRSILSKTTAPHLMKMPDLLAQAGVHQFQVVHMREANDDVSDQCMQSMPATVRRITDELKAECQRHGIVWCGNIETTLDVKIGCRERTDDRGICAAPFGQTWVTIDGNVAPCVYMAGTDRFGGNVLRQTLKDVFHGRMFRTLRGELKKGNEPAMCQGCVMWQAA